jgi:transcription initiation factor TFIIE subunit alpha
MVQAEELLLKIARELLGDEVTDVLKFILYKKYELTDEEIAKEMNIKVNEVRKKLYMLAEHGFVSYRKVRDKESGWYIYYWKPNLEALNEILLNRKRAVLEKLKARLEYEKGGPFYICPQDTTRFTLEESLDNNFRCPKCGSPLQEYDSQKIIKFLEEKIKELSEEIERETLGPTGSS